MMMMMMMMMQHTRERKRRKRKAPMRHYCKIDELHNPWDEELDKDVQQYCMWYRERIILKRM